MSFFSKLSNTKQVIILLLSFLLLINNTYSQHKYYFSSKAVNEGNGTKQQPFQYLQKLSQLALQPGDTVYFHAGDTLEGNIVLNNTNGTQPYAGVRMRRGFVFSFLCHCYSLFIICCF